MNAHFPLAHTSPVPPARTDLGNISTHSKAFARLGSIFLSERIEEKKKKLQKSRLSFLFSRL